MPVVPEPDTPPGQKKYPVAIYIYIYIYVCTYAPLHGRSCAQEALAMAISALTNAAYGHNHPELASREWSTRWTATAVAMPL